MHSDKLFVAFEIYFMTEEKTQDVQEEKKDRMVGSNDEILARRLDSRAFFWRHAPDFSLTTQEGRTSQFLDDRIAGQTHGEQNTNKVITRRVRNPDDEGIFQRLRAAVDVEPVTRLDCALFCKKKLLKCNCRLVHPRSNSHYMLTILSSANYQLQHQTT